MRYPTLPVPNQPSGPAHTMWCPSHPGQSLPCSPQAPGPDPPSLISAVPKSASLLQDPSLRGAPCPAPHQPCLAWRQAALSQFFASETSGISLGVSQNSPKAPLISYSCCTPAWQRAGVSTRSIPNPALGGRDIGGTALVAQPQELGDSSSLGKPLHLQRTRLTL